MRTSTATPHPVETRLAEQERTYKWLSRQTGIPYKRLLRVAKAGTQRISLEDAAAIADALDLDITVLRIENAA